MHFTTDFGHHDLLHPGRTPKKTPAGGRRIWAVQVLEYSYETVQVPWVPLDWFQILTLAQ